MGIGPGGATSFFRSTARPVCVGGGEGHHQTSPAPTHSDHPPPLLQIVALLRSLVAHVTPANSLETAPDPLNSEKRSNRSCGIGQKKPTDVSYVPLSEPVPKFLWDGGQGVSLWEASSPTDCTSFNRVYFLFIQKFFYVRQWTWKSGRGGLLHATVRLPPSEGAKTGVQRLVSSRPRKWR